MATETHAERVPHEERPVLPAIAAVNVEGLHGKFNYEIDLLAEGRAPHVATTGALFTINEERLTLLYGNNGTGKTSFLRTLFHALSAAPDRGHRGALANTRFVRFEIRMSDGTAVSYHRLNGEVLGRYRAEVWTAGAGQAVASWDYVPGQDATTFTLAGETAYQFLEPELIATGTNVTTPQLFFTQFESPEAQFLKALGSLGINPVLLSDSRAIMSDVLEESRDRREQRRQLGRPARNVDQLLAQQRTVDVADALERVRTYLSQLAFAGTQAGTQRVDTVYVNVASAIIQHASKVGRPKRSLVPSLRRRLEEIASRARPFHDYGLLPEFQASGLIELLGQATDKHGPLLEQVLTPYIDSYKERMDALEPGLRAVAAFIDAVNSFLEEKRAEFRLGARGVRIIDETTGETINPTELSSGEKQIVLLLSDIIALQDQTRLFIIDEPELSLNPHWQRQLMPSLLRVTEQSGMQLIAATHSIEVMSRYRSRLRRLSGR